MKKNMDSIKLSEAVQIAVGVVTEVIALSRLKVDWSSEYPVFAIVSRLNFIEGAWLSPRIFDEISLGKSSTIPRTLNHDTLEIRTISFSRSLHGSRVKLWVRLTREWIDGDEASGWDRWEVKQLIIRDNEKKSHRFTKHQLEIEKWQVQRILGF